MTISFSGLASGLDTSSWVESLVALKRAKITTLEEQKEQVTVSKTTLSTIKSFFQTFRASLEKVTDAKFGIASIDLFVQNLANSSNTSVLTATADTTAKEGTYKIIVDRIASNTEVQSQYKYTTTIVDTTTADESSKLINLGVENPYSYKVGMDEVMSESGGIYINGSSCISLMVDGIKRSIILRDYDTVNTFVQKLQDIGVEASYNEATGIFNANLGLGEANSFEASQNYIIDDGSRTVRSLIAALNLDSVNEGYTSSQLQEADMVTVYSLATLDTKLSELGATEGSVTINSNGASYNFNINNNTTISNFVYSLTQQNIDAQFDELTGILSIVDADITSDGANLINALGLDINTFSKSQKTKNLSQYNTVTVQETATLDTLISEIGTGISDVDGKTIVFKNSNDNYSTITLTNNSTIGSVISSMTDAGLFATLNSDGTVEIAGGEIVTYGPNAGTFDIINAFGLETEPYSAMALGNNLSETIIIPAIVDLTTELVGDLGVSSGYYEVTNPDGDVFYNSVYGGQTIADLISDLGHLGISATLDPESGILTVNGGDYRTLTNSEVYDLIHTEGKIHGATIEAGTNLLSLLGLDVEANMSVLNTKSRSMKLTRNVVQTVDATYSSLLSSYGISNAMSSAERTVVVYNSDGDVMGSTVVTENTTLGGLVDFINEQGVSATLEDGIITIHDGFISSTLTASELNVPGAVIHGAVVDALGIVNTNMSSYVLGSIMTTTTAVTDTVAMTTTSSEAVQFDKTYKATETDVISNFVTLPDDTTLVIHQKTGADVATVTVTDTMTFGQLFALLANYDVDGEIDDGIVSFDSDDERYLTGDLLTAMGMLTTYETTVVTTTVGTTQSTSEQTFNTTEIADETSIINDFLTITEENNQIIIKDIDGHETGTVTVTDTMSFADLFNLLAAEGVNGDIHNGQVTFLHNNGGYVDGSFVDALGVATTYTTTEITTTVGSTQATSTQTFNTTQIADDTSVINDFITLTEDNNELVVHTGVRETGLMCDITVRDTSTMIQFTTIDAESTLEQGTYAISTTADLQKLAEMQNNGKIRTADAQYIEFVLANDIDCTGTGNWTPIGTLARTFRATFDGNGHTISNIYIYAQDSDTSGDDLAIGLFGNVRNGTIKNLNLDNITVELHEESVEDGTISAGTLVGRILNGNIYNCSVSNSAITSDKSAEHEGEFVSHFIGGICGALIETTVSYSRTDATLSNGSRVGGIAGRSINNVVINNCYTSGNYSGAIAGGLFGLHNDGAAITITDSSTSANIQALLSDGGFIGGISSSNTINITFTSCYAAGTVENVNKTGKFIGRAQTPTNVTFDSCGSTQTGMNDIGMSAAGGTITGSVSDMTQSEFYNNVSSSGLNSGSVCYNDYTLTVTDTETFGDLFLELAGYGVDGDLVNGSVTFIQNNGGYVDGSFVDALGVETTYTTVVTTTTVGTTQSTSEQTFNTTEIADDTSVINDFITLTEDNNELVVHTGVRETGLMCDITVRDTSTMIQFATIDAESTLAQGTYAISTTADLQKLAAMQNGGKIRPADAANIEFVLANDIDCTGTGNWTPIGLDATCAFRATFDGNGHTISNVHLYAQSSDTPGSNSYTGIFGTVRGTIKNVNLENITGELHVGEDYNPSSTVKTSMGTLAGIVRAGNIYNCSVSSSTITSDWTNSDTNIEHYVGGLCGVLYESTIISYSKTDVTLSGASFCGGISGSINNDTLDYCYASGTLSGRTVGGLVGLAFGTISNSCSDTNIIGTRYSGGLVGYLNSATGQTSVFTSCLSSGTISSSSRYEGIIGRLDGNANVTFDSCGSTLSELDDIGSNTSSGTVTGSVSDITQSEFYDNVTSFGLNSGSVCYNDYTLTVTDTETFGDLFLELAGYGVDGDLVNGSVTFIQNNGGYVDGSFVDELGVETTYTTVVTTTTVGTTQSTSEQTFNTTEIADDTSVINDFITLSEDNNELVVHSGVTETDLMCDITVRDTSTMIQFATIDVESTLAQGTYAISTAADLQKLAAMQNGGKIRPADAQYIEFVLANDIDCTGTGTWTPIGIGSRAFKATFDGNGHTISNVYIYAQNSDIPEGEDETAAGLFGTVANGTIKNLNIENITVELHEDNVGQGGKLCAGVLVGRIGNGNIYNCSVSNSTITSDISATHEGDYVYHLIGGMCGVLHNSTVSYSRTDVTLSNGSRVGGIAGFSLNGNVINNCYATGNYSGEIIGGLVGYLNEKTITITDSSTSANIQAAAYAGGFIGSAYYSSNTINVSFTSCYAAGTVGNADKTGKFIGRTQTPTNVTFDSCGSTQTGMNDIGMSAAGGTITGSVSDITQSEFYDNVTSSGLNSGSVCYNDYTLTVSDTETFGDLFLELAGYGVDGDLVNGSVTFIQNNGGYVDGSFVDALGVETTYTTVVTTTTVGTTQSTSEQTFNTTEIANDTSVINDFITLTEDNNELVVCTGVTETGLMCDITVRDTSTMIQFETVNANSTLGAGTYAISTTADLQKLAAMQNGGKITPANAANIEFVLANDIDCTGTGNWTPIGINNTRAFRATFDGNGHTISNISLHAEDTDLDESNWAKMLGLFGRVTNGTIKNLNLENITGELEVVDEDYNIGRDGILIMGALVGSAVDSNIQNCSISGGSFTSDSRQIGNSDTIIHIIGGLCGMASNTGITDSKVDLSITGGRYTGGLIGNIAAGNRGVEIEHCYTSGSYLGITTGGMIGYAQNSGITITNSCTNANVDALQYGIRNPRIGGFIGDLNNTNQDVIFTSCYTSGTTPLAHSTYEGSFIGISSSDSNIIFDSCKTTWLDHYDTDTAICINGIGHSSGSGTIIGLASVRYITPNAFVNNVNSLGLSNSGVCYNNYTLTVSDTETFGDLFLELAAYGVDGDLVNGSATFIQNNGGYVDGSFVDALGVETTYTTVSATTTVGTTQTTPNHIFLTTQIADETSIINDFLTITRESNEVVIKDIDGHETGTVTVTNTMSFADLFNLLAAEGVDGDIHNGQVTFLHNNGGYVDGSFVDALGIVTTYTTTEITTTVGSTQATSTQTFNTTEIADDTSVINDFIEITDDNNELVVHTGVRETDLMCDITVRNTATMIQFGTVDANSTLARGTYAISTTEDLQKLATMQNSGKITSGNAPYIEFVLANDIDCTGTGNWTPIGSGTNKDFRATFDGNGYTISNVHLYAQSSDTPDSSSYIGIFGTVRGTVKNVNLENITGEIHVGENYTPGSSVYTSMGAIAGVVRAGNIYNCSVSNSTITSDWTTSNTNVSHYSGGLCGLSFDGTISYSKTDVTLSGGSNIGGISGSFSGGVYDYCYALGTLSGRNIGGLAGAGYNATISNSCSDANIIGNGTLGGLLGSFNSSSGQSIVFTSCHSNGTISSTSIYSYNGGIIGRFYGSANVTFDSCGSTHSELNDIGSNTSSGTVTGSVSDITQSEFYNNVTSYGLNSGSVCYNDYTLTVSDTETFGDLFLELAAYGVDGDLVNGSATFIQNNGGYVDGSFVDALGVETTYTTVVTTATAGITQATSEQTFNTTEIANDTSIINDFITLSEDNNELVVHTGVQETALMCDFTVRNTATMIQFGTVDANSTLARGTYAISTTADLQKLAEMQNNGKIAYSYAPYIEFVLANDIDCTGTGDWTPIGINNNGFHATFDGNGHTISNLYSYAKNSDRPEGSTDVYVGLFGMISGATIKNLNLENVTIEMHKDTTGQGGSLRGGVLAGRTYDANIYNCSISNSTVVSDCTNGFNSDDTSHYVGGMFGSIDSSTISYSRTDVTLTGGMVKGGIAGSVNSSSLIDNCYTTGDYTEGFHVGGFFGLCYMGMVTIANSRTSANVDGNSSVGGFVGYLYNPSQTINITFTSCEAAGTVGLNASLEGKFIGNLQTTSNVTFDSCSSTQSELNDIGNTAPSSTVTGSVNNITYNSFYDTLALSTLSRNGTRYNDYTLTVSNTETFGDLFLELATYGVDGDLVNGSATFIQNNGGYVDGSFVDALGVTTTYETTLVTTTAGTSQATGAMTYEATEVAQDESVINDFVTITGANNELVVHAGVNETGLMCDITVRNTATMIQFATVNASASLARGTYAISTTADLQKLAEMQNNGKISYGNAPYIEFVLANDIDCTGTGNWTPIADTNIFYATFDGNGHTISNVHLYVQNTDIGAGVENKYVGIFGTVAGTIKNLNLENITGELHEDDPNYNTGRGSTIRMGALAGRVSSGTIYNCSVSNCTITSDSTQFNTMGTNYLVHMLGGLLGCAYSSTISYSKTDATLSGGNRVGGISAFINDTDLDHCYASGNYRVFGGTIGGLVGNIGGGISRFTNSASDANLLDKLSNIYSSNVGGLVGNIYPDSNTNVIFTSCYATGTVENGTQRGKFIGYVQGESKVVNITFNSCGSTNSELNDIGGNVSSGTVTGSVSDITQSEFYNYVSSLGLNNGSVCYNDYTLTVTDTETFGDLFLELAAYGVDGDLVNGSVTFIQNNGGYVDGSFATALGITNTYTTVVSNTTYGISSTGTVHTYTTTHVADDSEVINDFFEITNANKTIVVTNNIGQSEFIADINLINTEGLADMATVDANTTISSGTYQISSTAGLQKLATMTNNGKIGKNAYFVLADDLDLSGISWTAIGTNTNKFKATFDGNGHVIHNLSVNQSTTNYQGLFGFASNTGSIKDLGVEDAKVTGKQNTGIIVGLSEGSVINCYAKGTVNGAQDTGVLMGKTQGTVDSCYAVGTVSAGISVGILVGSLENGSVSNCYTDGKAIGVNNGSGIKYTGGLVGWLSGGTITSCSTSGTVSGSDGVGGAIGLVVTTSHAVTVNNVSAYGTVSGTTKVGSFIGGVGITTNGSTYGTLTVTGSSALSQGINKIGFEGNANNSNSYSSGQMAGWNAAIGNSGTAPDLTFGSYYDYHTITVDSTTTFGSLAAALGTYGIDMDMEDGYLTLQSDNDNWVSGSLATALGINVLNNGTYSYNTCNGYFERNVINNMDGNTTLGQLELGDGTVTGNYLGQNFIVTVGSDTTINGFIEQLAAYGIEASVSNGAMTFQGTNAGYITGATGSAASLGAQQAYTTSRSEFVTGTNTNGTQQTKEVTLNMSSDTTFDEIGITQAGTVTGMYQGQAFAVEVQTTDTLGDLITALAGYGISGSIHDGVLTLAGTHDGYITGATGGMGTGIGNLGIVAATVQSTTTIVNGSNTAGEQQEREVTNTMNFDTTFGDLELGEGTVNICYDGQMYMVSVSAATTMDEFLTALAGYGISGSIHNGVLTLAGTHDSYITSATGSLETLGITAATVQSTTTVVSGANTAGEQQEREIINNMDLNTTFGDLGLGEGSIEISYGNQMYTVSVSATTTMNDFLTAIAGYGISGSINNGVLTLTGTYDGFIANATGSLGTGEGNLGIVASTIQITTTAVSGTNTASEQQEREIINDMNLNTTFGDLGLGEGTVNVYYGGRMYTVSVSATTTMNDFLTAIAGYGISGSINNGILTLTGTHDSYITGATGSLGAGEGNIGITAAMVQSVTTVINGSNTAGEQQEREVTNTMNFDTTFGDLGLGEGTVNVCYDGQMHMVSVSAATTMDEFLTALAGYGISGSIHNGVLTLAGTHDSYITSATGSLETLGITAATVQSTTTIVNGSNTAGEQQEREIINDMNLNTTFGDLGLEDGTAEVCYGGQTYTVSVSATTTMNDFLTAIAGYGISGSINNGVLTLSGTYDGYITGASGSLETLGITAATVQSTTTVVSGANTAGEQQEREIINDMNLNTTFGDLGLEDGTAEVCYGGQTYTVSVSATTTMNDFLTAIAGYGISGSINNGILTLTGTYDGYITGASGSLSTIGITAATVQSTTTVVSGANTAGEQQEREITNTMNLSTTFGDLNLGDGTVEISYGGQMYTVSVSATTTMDDFLTEIAGYGISGNIHDGVLTLTGTYDGYITNATGSLGTGDGNLGIMASTVQITTTAVSGTNTAGEQQAHEITNTMDLDTTFGDLGLGEGTAEIYYGGQMYTISVSATTTMNDFLTELAGYGITGNIQNGILTLQGTYNGWILNTTGSVSDLGIQQALSTSTTTTIDGENSTSNQNLRTVTQNMTTASTFEDIALSGENGTITIMQNGTEFVVTVDTSKTLDDMISTMAAYGISGEINNGQISLSGADGSFILGISENLSNALKLTAGLNNSYTTSTRTIIHKMQDNTPLSDYGITDGEIEVVQEGVHYTATISSTMTVSDFRNLLGQYGFTTHVDDQGRLEINGIGESYLASVQDGSNIITKLGLTQWSLGEVTSTSSYLSDTHSSDPIITRGTRVVDLQNEAGENLGIETGAFYIYENGVRNTLTIEDDTTVNDLMCDLAEHGIIADISESGEIAVSGYNNSYLETSNIAGVKNSNIVSTLFSEWNFTRVYESNDLTIPTPVIQAVTENTKLADIKDANYEAGTFTVIKDGVSTSVTVTADDTIGTFMNLISQFGFNSVINDAGQLLVTNEGNSTLISGIGEGASNVLSILGLENWITTNNYDGRIEDVTQISTVTVAVTRDTALSDMLCDLDNDAALDYINNLTGEYYIYNNGVKYTAMISSDETVGSFIDTLATFGIQANLVNENDSKSAKIAIIGNGDTYIAKSNSVTNASNIVDIFATLTEMKSYNSTSKVESTTINWSNATEDTILGDLEYLHNSTIKALWTSTVQTTGTIAVNVDGNISTINVSKTDTIGALLNKFRALGLEATISNGEIMIQSGYKSMTIETTGTSAFFKTGENSLNLSYDSDLGGYAASTIAVAATTTVYEDKTVSAIKFADKNTKVGTLNISSGSVAVYRDGRKVTVNIDEDDVFASNDAGVSNLQSKINTAFGNTYGDIVVDFDSEGYLKIYSASGAVVYLNSISGGSNIVSVAALASDEDGRTVTSSRQLYQINGGTNITSEGVFRNGNVTFDEGESGYFVVGEATISITNTTTMDDIVSQINTNEKSNAKAYWNNITGEFVITSLSGGASFVNIERGTTNFTDIMGYTTENGAINIESQKLGNNAKFKINGTSYTSNSNEISSSVSRIEGVTINLKDVTDKEAIVLKIEKDNETVADAVSAVVDSYNELMRNVDEAIAKEGDLHNETILKHIRDQLKMIMTSSDSAATRYINAAAVGLSTSDAAGANVSVSNETIVQLYFDKDKFINKLSADPDAVRRLLVGTGTPNNLTGIYDTGIFNRIENIVEDSLRGVSGYFDSAARTYDTKVSNLNRQISKAQSALEVYRAQLEAKFNSMDMLIAQMQQQYSSFLKS